MPTPQPCPHCDAPITARRRRGVSLGLCGRCGFVFPRVKVPAVKSTRRASAGKAQGRYEDLIVRASRYRAVQKLGGGQAEVYLVHHVLLDQLCVLKVISTPAAGGKVAVNRLIEEARAGFRVGHPNVVRVLDCDREGDRCYVVMEYVAGADLGVVVKELGRLVWQQAAQVAVQAAEGLAAIHEAGLVHGDIKPSNLLLCDNGAVKISDLGLAQSQAISVRVGVGQAESLIGTPQYMAPERLSADGVADSRTDLYALGATLYHLLVGRAPRGDEGILELMQTPARDVPGWPQDLADAVPAWFRDAVDRALAPEPPARWPSAGELAAALRADLSRLSSRPLPAAPLNRPTAVAVLAFRNVSGRPEDEWIGEALAERVRGRLIESADVYVVDRDEFARLLARKSGQSEAPLQRHIQAVAQLVGATLVVHGTYELHPEAMHVQAEVLETANRRVRYLARASAAVEDVLGADDFFARRVAEALSLPAERAASSAGVGGGTRSAKAEEKYARALGAFANGEYAEAADLAREAVALDANYFEPISFVGACYARLGQYDEALAWHHKAEQAARLGDAPDRLAEVLNNLGVMCYYKGDYAAALDYLNRSKELESKQSLLPARAKTWNNLGFVLLRKGDLQEAEQAFAASAELSRQLSSLAHLVGPYNGLGNVLLQQGRYEDAANYYRRALNLAEELEERVKIGVAHINLGRCNALLERYDQAQAEFDLARDTLSETSFWNGLAVVYEHLGDLNIQCGRPEQALEVVEKRLQLGREHNSARLESAAWEQKAHAHHKAGRTAEAVECLQRARQVADRSPTDKDLHIYLQEVVSRPLFLRRTSVGD